MLVTIFFNEMPGESKRVFTGKQFERIFLVAGYTDLRTGSTGLASIIQDIFHLDPFGNSLFLFCGRRPDRFKTLYWDGSGFVLNYKRIETGRLHWPRKENDLIVITDQQLKWLLEGLTVNQTKAIDRSNIVISLDSTWTDHLFPLPPFP